VHVFAQRLMLGWEMYLTAVHGESCILTAPTGSDVTSSNDSRTGHRHTRWVVHNHAGGVAVPVHGRDPVSARLTRSHCGSEDRVVIYPDPVSAPERRNARRPAAHIRYPR
jgi:hypothetical protein